MRKYAENMVKEAIGTTQKAEAVEIVPFAGQGVIMDNTGIVVGISYHNVTSLVTKSVDVEW